MTPKNTIINGGTMKEGQDGSQTLLGLWRHECERVFCDKLTNQKDKDWYIEFMKRHLESHFPAIADAIMEDDELFFVDFLSNYFIFLTHTIQSLFFLFFFLCCFAFFCVLFFLQHICHEIISKS